MVRRVAIGNFGGNFLFRVSRAGFDAVSSPLSNMILHENMVPLVPLEQGTVTVAPNGSHNAYAQIALINAYQYRPFVALRCDKNFTPSPVTYMARISGPGSSPPNFNTLRIFNLTGRNDSVYGVAAQTLTIKYSIFREIVPV